MQRMKGNLTLNALGFLTILLLASCAAKTEIQTVEVIKPVETVIVKNVPVNRPAPIVPSVDVLNLKDVEWMVITPENFDAKMAEVKSQGGEAVIFGLTKNGYENLSLNLSDVRSNIEQYRRVIAIYERSYN